MRICAGITYMVLGEAPDMSSVDDEVRQHWNSLSIETARREAQRQTHLFGPTTQSELQGYAVNTIDTE